MDESKPAFDIARVLVVAASLVIIIAGMKAAASLVLPFLVSAFLAILCLPPLVWLQQKKVNAGLAVMIVLLGLLLLGAVLAILLGTSLSDFYSSLPGYQERLSQISATSLQWLQDKGIKIPQDQFSGLVNPGAIMQIVANVLSSLGSMLTNSLFILLTVILMLIESASMPAKLAAAFGRDRATLPQFQEISSKVNRYLGIKTMINLMSAAFVTVWTIVLGVDFPLLWGLLTFLLDYVPNIGSILAALPPILIALITLGPGSALLVAIGFLLANFVMGNIIEPRFMGRGLGLSTLVVFISLSFWGWVLGPVGMIFSVPLTIIVKIIFASMPQTRWLAILLGNDTPAATAE
jgi:AI-2 transport protein TqsA